MSYERTEEHKELMSEAVAASWTKERRESLSEQRQGEANPFHGKHHSEEHRRLQSERMSGSKNPFFGKKHDRATAKLISKKLRGKSKGSIPRLAKYGVTEEQYRSEIASGKRWCSFGKHFAPLSDFAPRFQKRTQGGVCRLCEPREARDRMLRNRYGVDPDWYEKKFAEQNGGCAICKTDLALNRKKFLAIDHCHKTMNVRGILCARCNLSLARFECVPGWAEKAIAYLRSYGTEPA